MDNTQELSGQHDGPVNGYEVPTDFHSGDTSAEARRKSTDREATRYLSAATQISIGYAEVVVARVIREPFRALAPTFGVDVPVVTKWALKALQTRAMRDYILAAMFVLTLPILAVSFLWPQGLIIVALMLVAAWQAVSWERWERIHNIVTQKMLRDRFDPREAPSPRKEGDRARLEEVEKREGRQPCRLQWSFRIHRQWRNKALPTASA
jgi:hypothetical protein